MKNLLDKRTAEYCESCRRETATTVCALCSNCSRNIVRNRRSQWPNTDGDLYMRKAFGRGFEHYFKREEARLAAKRVKNDSKGSL